MSLALSKTLDPADFDQLTEELAVVDQYFTRDREQHPMRRWEYAMALRSFWRWYNTVAEGGHGDPYLYDVGGAGSPFRYMTQYTVRVIDPDGVPAYRLEDYVRDHPRLASCVFCLSVLEHVDDLDRFLYHLGCLVAPGGLLFLTVDCCACPSHDADMEVAGTPDAHHFHWMRKRMFGRRDLVVLAETLLDHSFSWLGDRDYADRPPAVYDYTFASLALVKRP